jgi:hypothetical protein
MPVEYSSSPGAIGNGASMDQDMRYAVKVSGHEAREGSDGQGR